MSEGHAFCAPSDWEGWSNCPGKPALEENEPDVSSSDAEFGSVAHEWAAAIFRKEQELTDVPADMRDGVELYLNAVRERVSAFQLAGANTVTLLVEQKLDISLITGEKDATGTADAIILASFDDYLVIDVWDLKFGVGVKVAAIDNGQLQIYGLAAMLTHGQVQPVTEVNLFVHQPRVRKEPLEWRRTPDELYAFGAKATAAAALALSLRGDVAALSHLVPGDKQCKFCRVKWRCPELLKAVHREVYGDFQPLDDRAVPLQVGDRVMTMTPAKKAEVLSVAMSKVPLIESWCLSVRAACDDAMLNERLAVPGFKVVQGRRGARRWTDAEVVLETIIDHGLPKEAVLEPAVLKSPTQLEKVFEQMGKKQLDGEAWDETWGLISLMVSQSEGKASVAPEDDPRPPWSEHSADDFDVIEEPLA